MRRASNILYTISIIVLFISMFFIAISGIVFLVLSSDKFTQDITEGIMNGKINTSYSGTPAEQAKQIQDMFKILGIVFMVFASLYLLTAIFSIIAKGSKSLGAHIITIVFGFLSFTIAPAIGGFLGIAAINQGN